MYELLLLFCLTRFSTSHIISQISETPGNCILSEYYNYDVYKGKYYEGKFETSDINMKCLLHILQIISDFIHL